MSRIEIVPLEAVRQEAVLGAVAEAFGSGWTGDWYRWKHLEGPWGPSWGRVAVDASGILGVRLLLPWVLRYGTWSATVFRAVEAATVPRARGQGVFRRLNEALMRQLSGRDRWTMLFSTPNMLSRGGYQKMGWSLLPPVAHVYRPAFGAALSRAAVIESVDAFDDFRSAERATRGVGTAWTTTALRWRFDPRSGRRYEVVRLRQSARPNGLVYRVVSRRGMRCLLVLFAWGQASEVRALFSGAARRERTPAVLEVTGAGARSLASTPGIRRGNSVLAIWEAPSSPAERRWPVADIRGWSLTMADLESVL